LALNTEQAYEKATVILKQRYGDKLKLADNFRRKIETWPAIKAGDGKALQELSDFLYHCETAMATLGHLKVLSDPAEHRKVLVKLPRPLQLRWMSIVDEHLYGNRDKDRNCEPAEDSYPSFSELCAFVNKQARIGCNPLFAPPPAGDTGKT
jgi:hypothetical protein